MPPKPTPTPEEERTLEETLGPEVTAEAAEGLTDAERDILELWNNVEKPEGAKSISATEAVVARAYQRAYGVDFRTALYIQSVWAMGGDVPAPSVVESHVRVYGLESASAGVREVMRAARPRGEAAPAAAAPTGPPAALSEEQQKWWDRAQEIAREKGLDPAQFARLIYWESRLSPTAGPSTAGAYGIGQFMPGTAKAYGIDPADPEASLQAAAQYLLDNYNSLQARLGSTDWRQAYAAYFFGAGGIADIIEAHPDDWEQYLGDYKGELDFVFGGGPPAAGRAGEPTTIPGVLARGIPGAEEDISDAERDQMWRLGLDLSDAEMKRAKRLGVSFEYYAFLKEAADALDTEPGLIHSRIQGGETLETIRAEAEQAIVERIVEKSNLGATQEERMANWRAAEATGLSLEEAELAFAAGVPFDQAATVKGQIEQLRESPEAVEEDIPAFGEAMSGLEAGVTPFDLQTRAAMERRAELLSPGGMQLSPAAIQEAEAELAEMLRRGDITPEQAEGRGGIFLARQELIKRAQVEGAESLEEAFDLLALQGKTTSEIRRRLERQFGPDVVAGAMERGGWRGATGLPPRMSPLQERFYTRAMAEAMRERERTTGLRPGEETRVPRREPRPPSTLTEEEQEDAERQRREQATASPAAGAARRTERGRDRDEDRERMEEGLAEQRRQRRRKKRTPEPAGFRLTPQ